MERSRDHHIVENQPIEILVLEYSHITGGCVWLVTILTIAGCSIFIGTPLIHLLLISSITGSTKEQGEAF